jgi:imidazolonepropionase-like amidohydrolase
MVDTGIWPETETNFRKAVDAGLIIAMGTDAGMPDDHFTNNYLDLKYMVEWGMTPAQAVTAGTLNAAKSLGVENKLGTLEVGKYADMLVLGKDPKEDISNVWNSREKIFLNGVPL